MWDLHFRLRIIKVNPFRRILQQRAKSEIRAVYPVVSKVKVDDVIDKCLTELTDLLDKDEETSILLREEYRDKAQCLCGIICSLQSLPVAYKRLTEEDLATLNL
jgi:hypothetical protein